MQADLEKRMEEVKNQITSSGTYLHTAQEIEMGARLAWRSRLLQKQQQEQEEDDEEEDDDDDDDNNNTIDSTKNN